MLNSPALDLLVPSLLILAKKAGHCIADLYHLDTQVFEKKDGSPVTIADQESHLILTKGLEDLSPGVPVISEENPTSWEYINSLYWLIDPLDGTAGFITKNDEFCINIALLKERNPIFGLIHLPITQETFYGYNDKAWYQIAGETTPIQTRSVPEEGMTLLLGDHRNLYQDKQEDFLSPYPVTTTRTVHSAIKFCHIAVGKADMYLRFEKCSEWDTAAGQALVEAAGGVMLHLDGSAFTYGKPQLINKEFVVFGEKNAPSFYT